MVIVGFLAVVGFVLTGLFFVFSQPLEPVSATIAFRVELELPDHISLMGDTSFEFYLEAVEGEVEMVVPMPLTYVEADASGMFDFGEIEFSEVGVFEYRIFQVDRGEVQDGNLVQWVVDESVFDVIVTVEVVDRELVADVAIRFDGTVVREAVFVNTNQVTFLGEWEHGIGDVWEEAHSQRRRPNEFVFKSGGNVDISRRGSSDPNSAEWSLTEAGQLLLDGEVFEIELSDDRLILMDEAGARRLFRSRGTRSNEEADVLIGEWQYGYGDDLEGLYNHREDRGPREIEFLPDGGFHRFRDDRYSSLVWDLDENGDLLVEAGAELLTFEFDVTNDVLTLNDRAGNVRSWLREGVESDEYRQWLITDYLEYFDVPEGYRLLDNMWISGDEFNVVIYELALEGASCDHDEFYERFSTACEESEERDSDVSVIVNVQNFVIVVKRDDVVFDVIEHETIRVRGRMSGGLVARHVNMEELVTEVDLDFDDRNDLLILSHDSASNMMYDAYVAYLQRDDGFEQASFIGRNWETGEEQREDPSCYFTRYIMNPAIDLENQLVLSEWRHWSITPSWTAFSFIDEEFVASAHLLLDNRWWTLAEPDEIPEEYRGGTGWGDAQRWTERVWLGDTWQDRELCTLPGGEQGRWGVRGFCEIIDGFAVITDGHDEELYQRIFGENVFWDVGRRWEW